MGMGKPRSSHSGPQCATGSLQLVLHDAERFTGRQSERSTAFQKARGPCGAGRSSIERQCRCCRHAVSDRALGRVQWAFVSHIRYPRMVRVHVRGIGREAFLARRYYATCRGPSMTDGGDAQSRSARGWRESGRAARRYFDLPGSDLVHQIFLVFVLGRMILGAARCWAPRPGILAFIVPTGFAPALRLMLQGNEAHVAMGLLAGLFTLATLMTTKRIHGTITSSLHLQFENQDLVEDLRTPSTS